NFISNKKYKYEDFIVKDLIPAIDKKYRTLSTRHGRVIAGLSMGGYGAIKYASKYPGMFFYAGSFSGAFRIPTSLEKYYQQNPTGVFRESLISAFGLNKSAHWENNDCLVLVDSLKEKNIPYLYLSCGKDDNATSLLDYNRLLVDKINKKGLLYEYHESPGAHNWLFWDKEIKIFLEKVASFNPF
ncbi:MAG: alpha/beta hydrolase-fold protein, partial [Ignavibacteria bacterium]|nr:alpha/beta hydrolase-fold protein [Ignavibacteria bacterium]